MAGPLMTRTAVATALAAAVTLVVVPARADMMDDVGVRLLQSPGIAPTINGTGIVNAIVEASDVDGNGQPINNFEESPFASGLYPAIAVTYVNSTGNTATSFPNTVGSLSSHASEVAHIMVGPNGVAPFMAGMFNYEADFFLNHIVLPDSNYQLGANIRVANLSFVITDTSQYALVNQAFDNFVDTSNVVVCAAVGNGPLAGTAQVQQPATAYNVISVGAFDLNPGSTGTLDGRTGVDITAPGNDFGTSQPFTSFSTPIVSGIATLMEQAGSLGLGGAGTQTSAMNELAIKAMLLNGATKPSTWTHTAAAPLDPQVGAGIVNAYASYRLLTGGQYTPSSRSILPRNSTTHFADTSGPAVGNLGWALQNNTSTPASPTYVISSTSTQDAINHFVLNLPATGKSYVLTATLTWNRAFDTNLNDSTFSALNNLDLFLYNGSTQITSSVSTIDNTEEIYIPSIGPGTYDLQVLKHGGIPNLTAGVASNSETYALSWSAPLVGDTNWDGVVDILDLTNVANHWQTNQQSVFNGDLNGDGKVDILDFTTVANNWQSGATSSSMAAPSFAAFSLMTSAPEPASLAMLVFAGVPLLLRRRTRRAGGRI